MKLVETKISETAVHMRYADNPDLAKANQWIDFQVPLDALKFLDHGGERALGNIEERYLGVIRVAALRYAREIIAAETQRLSGR
jgi:hypothetical protein